MCCLLLQTNMAAGHFSQTGIFDHARDEAFHFAFLIWALSVCPDGLGGESEAAFVFHIVFAIIGAAVVLALAGEPSSYSPSPAGPKTGSLNTAYGGCHARRRSQCKSRLESRCCAPVPC